MRYELVGLDRQSTRRRVWPSASRRQAVYNDDHRTSVNAAAAARRLLANANCSVSSPHTH